MKYNYGRSIKLFAILSLLISCASVAGQKNDAAKSTAKDSFDLANINSVQLTQLMGTGWNLGNSLESVGKNKSDYHGETSWGNAAITQELIDSIKASGFKTIRIPVAWSQNFSNEKNYVISEQWMKRVDQVVNYALKDDLFVVINIHWDGGWMVPKYAKQAEVNQRIKIMWTQIAERFKDYDHRLLFAGTNEVMVEGDYGTPTQEYYTVQNSFNQSFVDAVRATGGKNPTRFLIVQGFNTNIDYTVKFAKVPTDTVQNRLLMEVHFYDPYDFTLNTNTDTKFQWGNKAQDKNKTAGWGNEDWVDTQFQRMKTNFVDKGVGVVLGEYGVVKRNSQADAEAYRIYWNQYVTQSAIKHSLVPIYWDNGYPSDHALGLFDRATGKQAYPAVIKAVTDTAK